MRAARALLNWSQADLARAAGLSEVSVKNIERGVTDPRLGTMRELTQALVQAGVVLIPENGGGAGVRLFKEPLIGWRQCITPFPGDYAGIQIPFEAVFMAQGAPEDAALFCRTTSDHEHKIFLISPLAARYESRLAGSWVDARNPSLFGWTLLVGSGNPYARLGIKPPRLD
jgi:transcriptional regulator with XRE-family HTH domain